MSAVIDGSKLYVEEFSIQAIPPDISMKDLLYLTSRLRKVRPEFLFLLLPWLIFFSPLLSGQQVYFLDDLKIIFYPLEHVYAEFQASGHLPQWSNVFGFGHPLIAWGQLGFFTPVHLVLRMTGLHPLTLLQVSLGMYFLFGLWGMFVFLRARRLTAPAAVLGSYIFVFSGFSIGHLNHVNFYTSTMLLPW
ncbi:MAG: hypothetical protein ACRD4B_07070, partial [Acidobacteriota bacterium]